MKKLILLIAVIFAVTPLIYAQRQHKIVFELVSADTADHSAIIRQINNVLKAAPNTQMEVVCHGPAIVALIKDKSYIREKIERLSTNRNIVFAACANSLKRFNFNSEQVIPAAIVVPVAILEIVEKQEDGWSYIKSGH